MGMSSAEKARRVLAREYDRSAKLRDQLRAGERLVEHYDAAAAMCDCSPTHIAGGVGCIEVARSGAITWGTLATPTGVDRCLTCNAVWTMRGLRSDPAQLLSPSVRVAVTPSAQRIDQLGARRAAIRLFYIERGVVTAGPGPEPVSSPVIVQPPAPPRSPVERRSPRALVAVKGRRLRWKFQREAQRARRSAA